MSTVDLNYDELLSIFINLTKKIQNAVFPYSILKKIKSLENCVGTVFEMLYIVSRVSPISPYRITEAFLMTNFLTWGKMRKYIKRKRGSKKKLMELKK